ncbi:hypothetical protein [Paenibacillus alkalitolerans]|uniref:hypothetical protein n=1 Tax=Paenibacillus alkalitolerans TaxID=2799335 RepID=UPI0018F472CA|nr:hypothetical protein [Paenibacillus alkalitolerans]
MKFAKSWWLLLIVSLGVMTPFIAPYLTLDPARSRIPINPASVQYPLLLVHIVTAFIALLTGFLQFIEAIRINKPAMHRYLRSKK